MDSVSRFALPKLTDLPDDIRVRIEQVQAKSGFIPNVFLALSYRPDEFRAFFAYHDALMLRDSALSKAEREMIVVATSAANDCGYCVIAHGALLRIYGKDPILADLVAVNYRSAALTPRQQAMLDFALKLAINPAELSGDDHQALRAHGFTDADIWDIGAITSFFALSNRMAHLTGMQPNAEFHIMGRVPRGA